MGAQYGVYLARRCTDINVSGPLCEASDLDDYFEIGPRSMLYWLPVSENFIDIPEEFEEFDANYLILWGARFDPLIFHEVRTYRV